MNLSRLRTLLGAREAVVQHERKLSLDARRCWVDALALDGWMACARPPSDAGRARRDAERVLALYRGPFLGDEEGAWASAMRDRLRRRVRSFGEALAQALQRAGSPDEAQAFSRELDRRDAPPGNALAGANRVGSRGA